MVERKCPREETGTSGEDKLTCNRYNIECDLLRSLGHSRQLNLHCLRAGLHRYLNGQAPRAQY